MTETATDTSKFGVDGFVNGVPANWKPTRDQPVPVIQCTAIANSTGQRCRRMSLRGCRTCVKHGAQLPNVREHAAAVVESGRMRILNNVDVAVDVLELLMQPGTSEAIMLKASTEILDRAGINAKQEISVEVTTNTDPALEIRNKLSRLAPQPAAIESDTIDAEIIEDQDTLF